MANELTTITGVSETQQWLGELAKEIVNDVMQEALIAGSSVVQEELRANVPKRQGMADKREFPPLSESLVTDIHVDANRGIGFASTGFGESGPVALWNEYGHRIVTHSKVDTGKVTEPNPFMRRSTDNCAERAIDAFTEKLSAHVRTNYGS